LSKSEIAAIKMYAQTYAKSYVSKLHVPAGDIGPVGPPGQAGSPGQPGDRGPSEGVEVTAGGAPASGAFTSGTAHTLVTNAGLAAGSYELSGKVNLALTASGPGHGTCTLTAGGDTDQAYFWSMDYNGLIAQVYTFNVSAIHTFAATGSATVQCQVNGTSWAAVDSNLTAVKLGTGSRVPGGA
jgi:hypothetical protein